MHWRPRSFLRAVTKSVPATAGVLIQFPFYGGIFGMISKTPIAAQLAHAFVSITTKTTFPIVVAIYSAILGMFVPSGGGKWIVEAPYVMAAARQWGEHLGWTVQIYNAAEALPNLINPFWMLPLMGILNVRARPGRLFDPATALSRADRAAVVLGVCDDDVSQRSMRYFKNSIK
jgi:short-chain fatty acids transporter